MRIKEGLHLRPTKSVEDFINAQKKVYLIGYWARYGVREYPYAGKMVEDNLFGYTPLVFDFDGHNGTKNEYIVKRIQEVTTGGVIIYCFNKELAQQLADMYNEKAGL